MSKVQSEYEIRFEEGNSKVDLQTRILGIQVDSELGKSSTLKLKLAFSLEELQKITIDSVPKKIQVLWNKRLYFTGEAVEVKVVGHTQVEITFQDLLHRLDHMFTESQTKQQKLKSFLEKLLSGMQTPPTLKFCSPDLFDEDLPAFSLTARPIRDILNELAEFYGFTYIIRPDQSESTPTLCFLRTGKAISNQAIALSLLSPLRPGISSHHVQWKYNTVTVGLTDGVGEAKKKPLRTDSFRQPLSGFKNGEKMKLGFEISLPELEIPVSHPDLYSRAEKLLPFQFHLKQQTRDFQHIVIPESKVQVGDLIQIKDSFSEYQNDASYLVKSTRLLIQGSNPKLEVIAVRP